MRRLVKLLTLSFLLGNMGFVADAATNRSTRAATTNTRVTERADSVQSVPAEMSVTKSATTGTLDAGETEGNVEADLDETTNTSTSRIHAGRTSNGSIAIVGQGSDGATTERTLSSSVAAAVDNGNEPLSVTPGLMASTIDRDPRLMSDGQTLSTQLARAQQSRGAEVVDSLDSRTPDLAATPMNGPGSPNHDNVVRAEEAARTVDPLGTNGGGLGTVGGGGSLGSGGNNNAGLDNTALGNAINGDFDNLAQGSFQPPTATGGGTESRSSNLATDLARSTVISRMTEGVDSSVATSGTAGASNRVGITSQNGTVTGTGQFGNTTSVSTSGATGTNGTASTLIGSGPVGSQGPATVTGNTTATTATGTSGGN